MTVQHQSYLELKKEAGEELARRAVLCNLKSLKNTVRRAARTMNSLGYPQVYQKRYLVGEDP